MHGYTSFHDGDVNRNDKFELVETTIAWGNFENGYNILHEIGADLFLKLTIFKKWN